VVTNSTTSFNMRMFAFDDIGDGFVFGLVAIIVCL